MTRIGILSVSDHAARSEYADLSGPVIANWLGRAITLPWEPVRRIITVGVESVRSTPIAMSDEERVDLLLITGGTGPLPSDCTPEAPEGAIDRLMPGFGEEMRHASLRDLPTTILCRQLAGLRGKCLILSMPGKPSAVATCLNAIFAAVSYCLDLAGGERIATDLVVVMAFRSK